MKTYLRILLLLLLSIVVDVASAYQTYYIDGVFYNFINDEAAVTYIPKNDIGHLPYHDAVIIPESVTYNGKTYSVTSIGERAFYGCSGLTSITIPNSVTSIGENAFRECYNLISVTLNSNTIVSENRDSNSSMKTIFGEQVTEYVIGNSVKRIGYYAFYDCSVLTSITIGSNVTSIERYAFFGCSGLTSVIISNSVTTIGDYAFSGCSGLTSVSIPNSLWRIGKQAFSACSGLTSVNIPNSVTEIRAEAFSGCIGLTSITISNNVTIIDEDTFRFCSSLTYVTIPESVTSIGDNAFLGCTSLNAITFSDSLRKIGNNTFCNCSSLTSLTIPNSMTSIGSGAFFDCTSLTSVTIPNSVTSIGAGAFYGTTWFNNQPDGLVYAGNIAYRYKGKMSTGTEISIKEGTLGISANAFEYCSGLTSVTIPNGVMEIGNYAFSDCSGLKNVYSYAENVPRTGYGVYFNSPISAATLHVPAVSVDSYRSNSPWKDFGKIIPIGETPSSDIVFFDANVKSFCIANWDLNKDGELSEDEAARVTYLGEVFKGNTSIASFDELQYFTGLKSIDNYAFENCTGLTSIVIPYGVTSIGSCAFKGCSILTSVTIPNSVTSIVGYAFKGCNNLTSIDIPESITSISYSVFDGCSSLTSIIIPNGVTSIGSYTFSGCSSLTSIIIPNNVTNIDYCAFYKCSSLTSVSIGSSVTSIGNSVFANCPQLKDVYCYAENVPSADSNAFENTNIAAATLHVPTGSVNLYKSTSLWSGFGSIIPLGGEVEDNNYINGIYYNFSENDAEVTNGAITYSGAVVIPESVVYKGKSYSVTSISEKAFSGCRNITAVTIPASVTSVDDNAFKGCTSMKNISMETSKPNKHSTRNNSDERWHDYVAISGTHGVNDSEDYPKLLDNDTSTKWCIDPVGGTIYIEFDATCPIKPTGYVLTTGNDTQYNPGRNPKSWIIKGRNSTSDDWTTLTTVDDGNMPTGNFASKTFSFNNNSSYRYYRFEVTSLVSGTIFQLSEFCFLISDNNDEPIDEDTNVLVLGSNGSSPLFSDCPLDSVFIGRNISYSTSSDKGYSPFYCNTPLRSVNISGAAKEVFSKEFYGCTNLKNVQIGGKMSTIGDYAFYGCTGLKEFYCEAEQTPAVTSSSFKNVDVSAVMLVVPDNSVELYKAHPIWKLFWVETPTGIKETNSLTSGLSKGEGDWYDLQGRKLAEPQKGINIIRYRDGTTRKVLVR